MAMQTPAVLLACPVQPGCSVIPVLVALGALGKSLCKPLALLAKGMSLCQPEAGPGCSLGSEGQVAKIESSKSIDIRDLLRTKFLVERGITEEPPTN